MNIESLTNDLEKVISAYTKRYKICPTTDWYMLKLNEELGELTQSYLKMTGQARTGKLNDEMLREAFEDELADVIGMALLLARTQGVDLDQAFDRKWLSHLKS